MGVCFDLLLPSLGVRFSRSWYTAAQGIVLTGTFWVRVKVLQELPRKDVNAAPLNWVCQLLVPQHCEQVRKVQLNVERKAENGVVKPD